MVNTGDWIFDSNGIPLTNKDPKNPTTNKNMTFFKACHAFHIINIKRFKEDKLLWEFKKNDPHLIKINNSEAVDVDTIEEFYLAEKIYKDSKN